MDFMFDWENEGDRFSFEDSDRFEEDSLCSWISEPESLCNNWRGWKRQNGGQVPSNGKFQDGMVTSLVELASKAVACHIPFEVVEHFPQPIPEQLQLRIAFWSFPENEEDIRLYSCLASGSADEFQKGEHLYKAKAVKDVLQIGFHLSGSVVPPQGLTQTKGNFNVAVVFDRRRISSCTCTCNSQPSWCSHVVALCLYRIHQATSVCLRAPVSESLSRLHRDQLQKFAQYLISELPQQILPTAQRLLDELLSSQETAMNTVCGAPDPTAGPSANEQTSWCLDESTLHENVKKTLVKFCVPSPIVFSDVNYLSATAPPAAAEWQSLLRPLRGREPEGMWNLLSIVREMFRRDDSNAIPLLEIITDEVLQCEQILIWWFTTKATSNNNNNVCRGNNGSGANATQHAAASLCDEIVTLWRLAALNPKLSPIQRDDLCVLFARAEALHAHGQTREACRLAQRLAEELLTNPPDLLAETANLPSLKGKKKKALTNISLLASSTLSKAAFLCSVLTEEPDCFYLAFKVGMFGLELPRPPASCKALEVKLAYQETEVLTLLKKIPLGNAELAVLREKAEELRDGIFKSRGDALLPLTLASFIFDSLCLPVYPVGSTNSRPPSRSVQITARTPADEKLGFDGAVAALGLKANVSEAEHPLLCESTRRQRGELAIAMLVHYKDDPQKLSRIMDKLLDKEIHQQYKAPSLMNYLGVKTSNHSTPTSMSQASSPIHPSTSQHSSGGAMGGVSPDTSQPSDPRPGPSRVKSVEGCGQSPSKAYSSGARPKITYPLRYNSGKDTDSSAVEEEDELRALEAKLKCMAIKKKPSQGMASIDSSAPETTSSDNSPTLVRRTWSKLQGPGSDCGSSADSDSLGSSSSGEKDSRAKLRDNDSPPSPLPAPILRAQQQLLLDGRNGTPNVKNTRYKGKSRAMPTVPNQPSEALAHFMFELSKNVLSKAGGNSSTSLFTQPSNTTTTTGPHRNLHICAFQIGLYALGLNNCVSPNWLSRTYSSHVSWITGQATDIGSTAINILIDTWEGHLTPPEVASLADKASRGRDPAMVKAAAELALSCLPHAQALNPSEVQRALFQCKEQSREMLEKACLAVESAAKGGGVYPEVLFDVARERQSPSAVQILPIASTPPHSNACNQVSSQVIAQSTNPIPAQPMVLSYAIPQSNHPTLPHQTLVQHIGYVQQIPPFGQQYPPQHIPIHHSHNIHPYVTFPYQGQPPYNNLQGLPAATSMYPPHSAQFRPLGPAVQVFPSHSHCQMSSIQAPPVSSSSGSASHQDASQDNASNSPSPPHHGAIQHAGSQVQNQAQLNYLMIAFRVGMLALETLARRVHDDRPQTKYARNPPYGEDVKWLLGIAIKLGMNYLQQFCASTVNGVVSPFILYDIALEAAHVLARNNPAIVQSHLRSNILNPLLQKCIQMFTQCAHQRIHHINQSEYEDFVSIMCSARNAFYLTPGGIVQFQELLQSLRRSKSCRKELWSRIVHGLAAPRNV
ncbi:hypothetical protein FSP39_012583 [Pinctada imbricata]|uniref:SWIM-type domain-containing protein n=1 Tax=Pinctada imbricata TaxID=66713 RepID=A0AA88XRT9_PINIB|nr:hypothetical protein FSP39_012583 [Pinctada imbricata]